MTKNEILTELFRSKFMSDLIKTITSGHQLSDDLKSELFLILCEMDDARIKSAHKNHYLHYLCVNIVKKQFHSNTSPFHTKFRKDTFSDGTTGDGIWIDYDATDDKTIKRVIHFVDEKIPFVDRELFKMYYKIGKYDRWFGELRDEECQKPISSLRKVEKKLAIITIDGKQISIGHDTIRISLQRTLMRIKHYLKENDLD